MIGATDGLLREASALIGEAERGISRQLVANARADRTERTAAAMAEALALLDGLGRAWSLIADARASLTDPGTTAARCHEVVSG